MFTKKEWSKWQHITFVEEFSPGIPVYELLRREDFKTGDVQWKKIKVKSSVHGLNGRLIKIVRDLEENFPQGWTDKDTNKVLRKID